MTGDTRTYWSGRNVVYRCFDEVGAPLYIGATSNLPRRMEDHRAQAAWFPSFARLRVQVFPDRAAALSAERRAIKTEKPAHNVRSAAAGSRRGIRNDPRRIHPAGPELIRAFMTVRRMPVRELADLCGGEKHRAAIGHLLSGQRRTCSAELAESLQRVLLGQDSGVALFESPRHLRVAA